MLIRPVAPSVFRPLTFVKFVVRQSKVFSQTAFKKSSLLLVVILKKKKKHTVFCLLVWKQNKTKNLLQ